MYTDETQIRQGCLSICENLCSSVAQSDFDRAFKDKLGWAGQRDVTKLFPFSIKTDLELAPAAHDHTNRSTRVFENRENQRACDHTRAAGERFAFDAALERADRDPPRPAFLDEVHVRTFR